MKKSRNLLGIILLLLLLIGCQPATTIELNTTIPISSPNIPTPPLIMVTAQPTVVKEAATEPPHNESRLLFQIGNEEGGILYVDSGEVHYFNEQWRLHSWSPSGKQLLFSVGEMLYIADADGSNPRPAYDENEINKLNWPAGFKPSDFKGFWPAQWLTDEMVLLSLTTIDYAPLNPFLYLLDVTSGSLGALDLDNWYVIESISPDGTFWLQSSETGRQLATITGKTVPIWPSFFDGPSGNLPRGPVRFPILPDGTGFLFGACPEQSCHIFQATAVNLEILSIQAIFPLEPYMIYDLQISPNGQYLAFVQASDFFYFIDLTSKLLSLTLPYNEIYGPADLLWSPDSQILAYASATLDGYGIKGINVETGEISVIMETRFLPHLLDWRYISQ